MDAERAAEAGERSVSERDQQPTSASSTERFNVELEEYQDLSETEKKGVSDNGFGKEYASYLRVTHNGKTLLLESDAMEPEDVRFYRDLAWVKDMIQEAYMLGYRDGSKV